MIRIREERGFYTREEYQTVKQELDKATELLRAVVSHESNHLEQCWCAACEARRWLEGREK